MEAEQSFIDEKKMNELKYLIRQDIA